MDKQIKAMAEKAIAEEKPLPGYEIGIMDAGIRKESNELVVILLDGRKMLYPINMAVQSPAPTAKADPPKKASPSRSRTGKKGATK